MNGVDAGRLLAYATDVSAVPGGSGDSGDYTRLVRRYRDEAEFRHLVDDLMEGVGCEVTDARPESGLVIRSEPDGPWCWPATSADLPWNKNSPTVEERACRMLVIPALLAFVAPSAADFEDLVSDPTLAMPPVPVQALEQFIRRFAYSCEQANPDPVGDERPLWWHWLLWTAYKPTPQQKRKGRGDGTYIVFDVLQFLHRRGLMSKPSDTVAKDAVFRPKRRLLAHYRDLLVDDLFQALQHAAGEAD